MQNNYIITDADITEAVLTLSTQLDADPEELDSLALAALEDYADRRREMGLTGTPSRLDNIRAIARYACLYGYAQAMMDIKAALEEACVS